LPSWKQSEWERTRPIGIRKTPRVPPRIDKTKAMVEIVDGGFEQFQVASIASKWVCVVTKMP
jgi:hypothetical protein